nr:MAG TPA: hypothetical protein [Caudoviricetes sp.]
MPTFYLQYSESPIILIHFSALQITSDTRQVQKIEPVIYRRHHKDSLRWV